MWDLKERIQIELTKHPRWTHFDSGCSKSSMYPYRWIGPPQTITPHVRLVGLIAKSQTDETFLSVITPRWECSCVSVRLVQRENGSITGLTLSAQCGVTGGRLVSPWRYITRAFSKTLWEQVKGISEWFTSESNTLSPYLWELSSRIPKRVSRVSCRNWKKGEMSFKWTLKAQTDLQ